MTTINWRWSSTTRLSADTKTACLRTAEFAVRTWRWHSELHGSARCTICGAEVHTVRRLVAGELERWATALTGAMFEHLDVEHAPVTP
uniref:hypothetical protein n=1 Tax=Pseudonocardia sp. CA-138482 TaxID=3240023 RepID=UPI003F49618C